jgi:hypothetical protein
MLSPVFKMTQECDECSETVGLKFCTCCDGIFCEEHFDSPDYNRDLDPEIHTVWCGRCYEDDL